jgi:hypothetical protein
MREDNLRPKKKGELSEDEAKKLGHLGGVASVRARREKKKLRELAEMFKDMPVPERMKKMMEEQGMKDEDMTNGMAAVVGIFRKAQSGDATAFNAVRDILGEKPKDEVENNFNGEVKIGYVSSGNGGKFPSSEEDVDV